jgi:hypothetical protein
MRHLFVADGIYHGLGSCHFRLVLGKKGAMSRGLTIDSSCGSCWSSCRGSMFVNSFGTWEDQLSGAKRLRTARVNELRDETCQVYHGLIQKFGKKVERIFFGSLF